MYEIILMKTINTVKAQEHHLGTIHNNLAASYKEDKFIEEIKVKNSDKWFKILKLKETYSFKLFKGADINSLIREINGNISFTKKHIQINTPNGKIKLGAKDIRKATQTLGGTLKKSKRVKLL